MTSPPPSIGDRVDALDWSAVSRELDDVGVGLTAQLLSAGECQTLIGSYDDDESYRSTIDMARYRFGEGQ